MATKTNNLGLSKAELTDAVRSTLVANNDNFDKIDSQISRLKANQPKGTASGTEIVVEDSAEMESVLSVSGNSEQDSRSGKNLFDKDNPVLQADTTKTTVKDNSIELEILSVSSKYTSALIPIKNSDKLRGKQITLSGQFSVSGSNTGQIRFLAINNTGHTQNEIGRLSTSNKPTTLTLPTEYPEGTMQFGLRFYSNAGSNSAVVGEKVVYTNIQLEEGSTATAYEPYGVMPSPDYPSEIRSVKSKSDNLFDMDSWTVFEKQDDGSYKTKTTAYPDTSKIYLDLPIGVYTLSYKIKCEVGKNYKVRVTYEDGEMNQETVTSTGDYVESSTVLANKKISYITVSYSSSSPNVYIKDFMLNKGDKALPYQPYGYVPVEVKVEGENVEPKIISLPLGDIELRSVPSGARDTFVKKDGVWNKHEKVGAFIITQDMFSTYRPDYGGLPMISVKVPNIVSSWKAGDALFTSYKEKYAGITANSYFGTTGSNVAFEVSDIRFTDEATAKALLLGETGITELKTHNYIPITDATLIQALDTLEQLVLHKGYNRITVTSVNGVKAYLDLAYTKDINSVLDNINAMLLTLGGGTNV